MKTLIKLIIAGLIVNAAAHGGMAAWHYFQLRDSAQQTVVFGANSTPEEIADAIVQRAVELNVPLEPENVEVTRNGPRTVASATYTVAVAFLPMYEHPVTFSFSVDGVAIKPPKVNDLSN
jgi:hypothetical protein